MNTILKRYLLVLSIGIASGLIAEEEKQKKELFLECWETYVKNYITENNITIEPNSNDSALEQWNRKFTLFKNRLKTVEPIYERWKKDYADSIKDNFYWRLGKSNWLLVFLGLKPRFEYDKRFDQNEINFIQQELENIDWIKEYKIKEKNFNIEVIHGLFFEQNFIEKYTESIQPYTFDKLALYFGLTPNVFGTNGFSDLIMNEEKKINNKTIVFDANDKFNNGCTLLIPGAAIISYQTPYTILYGRLIQYALVYLEKLNYYLHALLEKMQQKNYYDENSWLAKNYYYFYSNPLRYDKIYDMYKGKCKEINLDEDSSDISYRFTTYEMPTKKNLKVLPKTEQPSLWSQITSTAKRLTSTAKRWWKWLASGTLATVGAYVYLKYYRDNKTEIPTKK